MNFVFGLIIGIIIGCIAMHMVHEYLDSMLPEEEQEKRWLERKCPPCDGECKQGRDCPALDQNQSK
jgi:hypothetical protein